MTTKFKGFSSDCPADLANKINHFLEEENRHFVELKTFTTERGTFYFNALLIYQE